MRWEGTVGQLLALAQRRRMGQIPQRMHGVGTEPYALREYLPGDPIGKIHWKATARHGRPVTREDTWERSARLVVLLDCARAMAGMDGRRSKLDYAVAATLALTRVAAARGDQVTIVAFADRVLRTVRVRSGGAARRSPTRRSTTSRRASSSRPTTSRPRRPSPSSRGAPRRCSSPRWSTSRRPSCCASRSSVSGAATGRCCSTSRTPELRALAAAEPATPAAAFAQVASLEIQLANRRLARHLRRGGIRVINTPADRLALEALEGYLAIFRGAAAPGAPARP